QIRATISSSLLIFDSAADPPALHSFPTRRSSDLGQDGDRESQECGLENCGEQGQGDGLAGAAGSRGHGRLPGASAGPVEAPGRRDRKSTRLNSSHDQISYAVFCLKKKKKL